MTIYDQIHFIEVFVKIEDLFYSCDCFLFLIVLEGNLLIIDI